MRIRTCGAARRTLSQVIARDSVRARAMRSTPPARLTNYGPQCAALKSACAAERRSHLLIDIRAAALLGIDGALDDHRLGANLRRIVAFMTDRDELVRQAETGHYLGGTGK